MLKKLLDFNSFCICMHVKTKQKKKNPYSLSEFTTPKSKLNNICQISILFDLLNIITQYIYNVPKKFESP